MLYTKITACGTLMQDMVTRMHVVFGSLWTANAMIPIHALLSGFVTASKCLDLPARQRVMWSKQDSCQEYLLLIILKLSSRDGNLNG